jgi:hypothetical protein
LTGSQDHLMFEIKVGEIRGTCLVCLDKAMNTF